MTMIVIISVFVLASSSYLFQYDNIYGQILNDRTVDTMEIHEASIIENRIPKILEINTGDQPTNIAINQDTNTVYVTNLFSDTVGTVSVISMEK
jgi:DNA-binding beta-propeller fold protein YncE